MDSQRMKVCIMQWIAMAAMLIDHIGVVWFEDQILWRIIGRLAFPIYAYYAAQGMFLTRNRRRYVLRLGLLAVVSQLPFVYVLDTVSGNVIVTLLICVLGIYGFTNEGFTPAARWTSLITCAVLQIIIPMDYGLYALLLMLIYRSASGWSILWYHAGLNLVYAAAGLSAWTQLWSVLPSAIFSLPEERVREFAYRLRAPKWLWRSFYPGHLYVLGILSLYV